jgi:arginase family enzyme
MQHVSAFSRPQTVPAALKSLPVALHLDLDGAWNRDALPFDTLDATEWGRHLRFSARPRAVENFYREVEPQLAPFLVYGSGDFHHLTALWIRRIGQPITVVSFDNHPDWDIRPPKWCCGSWVNRALELPHVQKVSVWGCGNFECWWPRQIFGNRRAERRGRLEVHPWADDRPAAARERRGAIVRQDWQQRFLAFVKELAGDPVYVTVDLDCLRAEDAVTNWESGRFTLADLEWALCELRNATCIVAGDICGAFSLQRYARRKQRFAARMDHPKLARRGPAEIREINDAALGKLWPLLTA